MARKTRKAKPKTYLAGRLVFVAVSVGVAAAGTLGWLRGDGDLVQRLPFAFLAAAAGFVIPVCAGQMARGFRIMALPALLFAAWSAYSLEHANEVLVEAPRAAAHALAQAPAHEAVRNADALLTALQAKRANFVEEKVDCSPCRNTKADAALRDKDRRVQLDKDIALAKADVEAKKLAIEPYKPLAPWWAVLLFGALIDAVIAIAIGALEASARRNVEEHEAKRERERKAREQAAKAKPAQKPKAPRRGKKLSPVVTEDEARFLIQARGPRLVVDNLVG